MMFYEVVEFIIFRLNNFVFLFGKNCMGWKLYLNLSLFILLFVGVILYVYM